MSVLNQIAYCQNRQDDVPNQELARRLAQARNTTGIQEIAENLWNKNQNVRSDCLKVLYEVGYLEPGLIAGYAGDFLRLLEDKNNRMVWGGMIALAAIAPLNPEPIWEKMDDLMHTIEQGTVITQVNGVKVVAGVASTHETRRRHLFPWLMDYLKSCPARDVPIHAESILCAVDEEGKATFLGTLDERRDEMKPSQSARLRKVIRNLEAGAE